ncbi:hypothetical protein ACJX0J_036553 [Zea mays]
MFNTHACMFLFFRLRTHNISDENCFWLGLGSLLFIVVMLLVGTTCKFDQMTNRHILGLNSNLMQITLFPHYFESLLITTFTQLSLATVTDLVQGALGLGDVGIVHPFR